MYIINPDIKSNWIFFYWQKYNEKCCIIIYQLHNEKLFSEKRKSLIAGPQHYEKPDINSQSQNFKN